MLVIYCRGHHGRRSLCAECDELWRYVQQRVGHCRFGSSKPTCLECSVHCFAAASREKVRAIMRYSGPRMLWRHPVLSIMHMINR